MITKDEPAVGYYCLESIASSSVLGSHVLTRGGEGKPHHVVYATTDALHIVPLRVSVTESGKVITLDMHTKREHKIVNSVLWLWGYTPPPSGWKRNVASGKDYDRIKNLTSEFEMGHNNYFLKHVVKRAENFWPSQKALGVVEEGVMILTERLDLLLFGVHVETLKIRLMSKITLRDQANRYSVMQPDWDGLFFRDCLTIDPSYKLIVISLFAHRLEFLPINPEYPFAWGSCYPRRPPSMDIKGLVLLAPDLFEVPDRPQPKSAKRHIAHPAEQETPTKRARRGKSTEPPSLNSFFYLLLLGPNELSLDRVTARDSWNLRIFKFTERHDVDMEIMPLAGDINLTVPDTGVPTLLIPTSPEKPLVVLGATSVAAIQLNSQSPLQAATFTLPNVIGRILSFVSLKSGDWVVSSEDEKYYQISALTFAAGLKVKVRPLGTAAAAACLTILDEDDPSETIIFVGSNLSSSQVVSIDTDHPDRSKNNIEILYAKESPIPILDFENVPGQPLVLAGGWGSTAGLRIVQPGLRAQDIFTFPKGHAFSYIHPLGSEAFLPNGDRMLAILSQAIGPSLLLCSRDGGKVSDGLRDISISARVSAPIDADLGNPTIALLALPGTPYTVQLTADECRLLRSDSLQLQSCWSCGNDARILSGVVGDGEDIFILKRDACGEDVIVKLLYSNEELSELIEKPLNFGCQLITHGRGGWLAVAEIDEPLIHLLDDEFLNPIPSGAVRLGESCLSLANSRHKNGRLRSVARDLVCWEREDASGVDLVVLTECGELIVARLSRGSPPATPTESSHEKSPGGGTANFHMLIARRQLGLLSGRFSVRTAETMLLCGEKSFLIVRDTNSNQVTCNVSEANAPPEITQLGQVQIPSLTSSLSPTEKLMLWLSTDGDSRQSLTLGIFDLDWKEKRFFPTLTGFCIEHVVHNPTSGHYVAAGMQASEIISIDDLRCVDDLREHLRSPMDTGVGIVLLLRPPSSDAGGLSIEQIIKLEADECPMSLSLCRLEGEDFIALGTETKSNAGAVRLIRVLPDRAKDADGMRAKLELVALTTTQAPVIALAEVSGCLAVAVGNTVKFYRLDDESSRGKIQLTEKGFSVLFNLVVDLRTQGNLLLVADAERSVGLLEVSVSPGGSAVVAVEVARDLFGMAVLSVEIQDASTFLVADNNGNIVVLQFSEDITRTGGSWGRLFRTCIFRIGQQVNKMKKVKLVSHRLLPSNGEKTALDFFLQREELKAIQYATRQGAVGLLIPIYDPELLKTLELLTKAIRENTAFIGDLCPDLGRSCVLANEQMPRQKIVDGALILNFLSKPPVAQAKVYSAFLSECASEGFTPDALNVMTTPEALVSELERLVGCF